MGVPKGLIYPVPAISLGACEMSLYEQVGAMNTFPNQGVYVEPIMITKICNNKGALIEQFTPKHNDAIDAQTAYKTVRLMQGVVEYGTGFRLRGRYEFRHPVAGKTGTTDNNSDGWFIGYTPLITCGVWVGCDDRSVRFRTTDLGQGANTALPIFALFMNKCYNDPKLGLKPEDFQPPPNMDHIEFDCSKYKPEKPVNRFD
jgi:penicillin-binding protein 1A